MSLPLTPLTVCSDAGWKQESQTRSSRDHGVQIASWEMERKRRASRGTEQAISWRDEPALPCLCPSWLLPNWAVFPLPAGGSPCLVFRELPFRELASSFPWL